MLQQHTLLFTIQKSVFRVFDRWICSTSCSQQMEGRQSYSFTNIVKTVSAFFYYVQLVFQRVFLLLFCAVELAVLGGAHTPNKQRPKRVLATDGTKEPLQGVCVFFLRPNNSKPVSTANMVEVSVKLLSLSVFIISVGTNFNSRF